jgi:hypothetical protein
MNLGWQRACGAFGLVSLLILASCGGGKSPDSAPTAAKAAATGFTGNGTYWNPQASGSGIVFEAQGDTGVATFFVYEAGGRAVWYTGAGPFTAKGGGKFGFSATLMRYSGGQAGTSAVPVVPTSTPVGDVSMEFDGDFATVTLPGRSYTVEKFNRSGQGKPAGAQQPETGIYWNAGENGRGYTIEVNNDVAQIGVFHYDASGEPTWNLVVGSVATGELNAAFGAYSGGQTLAGPYKAPASVPATGQFVARFNDPCVGSIQFPGMASTAVRRFAFGGLPAGAECRTRGAADINATTSYRLNNTMAPTEMGAMLMQAGLQGHYFDSRVYIDLDGDGVNEIVVAPGRDSVDATPTRVFKKGAGGSYTDQTASFYNGAIPAQIHPRKTISADFNGDGKPDFFFIDHGYDHMPFPGAQTVLALSDATGKLKIKDIPGNKASFQHCGTAGDIDNNGTIDIFVCSDAWQGADKASYFLVNDGAGNMTIDRNRVPAALKGDGMIASELVDVDGDGYLDLIAGYRQTGKFYTRVFWGNGSGNYTDGNSVVLPTSDTYPVTYDIKAEDIDGDGRRDIVLLNLRANLSSYYFVVLKQTQARVFDNQSLARIIKNETSWPGAANPWFAWFHILDINGDGKPDIVGADGSTGPWPAALRWVNDGAGNFTKLP